MIQFNLLPDVKLEYIKAERSKRLVTSVSILVSAVAVGVLVVLFVSVQIIQKKNISDLNADIQTTTKQIQATPNLDKILTVQNQLNTLSGLHDNKPVSSRLFDYIGQVTPSKITIASVDTDFTEQTIAINGGAPDLDTINTYVDTLKFTTFSSDKQNEPAKAFTEVVLAGFSREQDKATYNITMKFAPELFKVTDKITLNVPKTITTRSVTEQPTIFQQSGAKQ